ncbi:MAG: hypothetical protein RLZZ511_4367 [Cyanobacteriota bacterium]|jgi:hypothetical protein
MAYSDFSLESVIRQFKLMESETLIFEPVVPIEPSHWLAETLSITQKFGLKAGTEKARSEFVVAPILAELERRNPNQIAIFSGKSLDVNRAAGLNGECDFIISKGEMSRILQAPILAVVEAKKQDIDLGLGQCVAQVIGAQLFNQQQQQDIETVYGCVTTGDRWQFLRLQQQHLVLDNREYSLTRELPLILGILQSIVHFVQ